VFELGSKGLYEGHPSARTTWIEVTASFLLLVALSLASAPPARDASHQSKK
jgi:hypothetical protein